MIKLDKVLISYIQRNYKKLNVEVDETKEITEIFILSYSVLENSEPTSKMFEIKINTNSINTAFVISKKLIENNIRLGTYSDRRIFYIDIGNIPLSRIREYFKKFKNN